MEDNKDKKNNQMDSSQHLPTKTQMLEHIYNKYADKTLSFGCRVVCDIFDENVDATVLKYNPPDTKGSREEVSTMHGWKNTLSSECATVQRTSDGVTYVFYMDSIKNNDKFFEVIGHPVMLGDILKHRNGMTTVMTLTQGMWRYLDKSIDVQPIECIEYVYNLDPIKQETV